MIVSQLPGLATYRLPSLIISRIERPSRILFSLAFRNSEIVFSISVLLVALAAFFLKGVTGTGTTAVIVALGSLFIDAKLTVVLASFINIFGGLGMVCVDPAPLAGRYWVPVSLLMVAGSVGGALALGAVSSQTFQVILGSAFLLTALWFLLRAPAPRLNPEPPATANGMDLGVGAFAGFCGGFIGIHARDTGIGALAAFPPVAEIYDRHDFHFKDNDDWVRRRTRANQYLLSTGNDTLRVIPYESDRCRRAIEIITEKKMPVILEKVLDLNLEKEIEKAVLSGNLVQLL